MSGLRFPVHFPMSCVYIYIYKEQQATWPFTETLDSQSTRRKQTNWNQRHYFLATGKSFAPQIFSRPPVSHPQLFFELHRSDFLSHTVCVPHECLSLCLKCIIYVLS